MLICASYGSSPTHRRHTVFPVFQPLISSYYPSEVCQRWSACRITASKPGWATAWWRMLNMYVPGPCLLFHVHLSPSQLISPVGAHKSSLGPGTSLDSESPQRHPSLFMQQHCAGKAVADNQEALLPSGGLLFLVSCTLWRKVAENQLSCQKGQKSFLRAAWLFYLFILLIYHTLVTSLIFLNLTNRLPRTQSIWLSSANKPFAMCLLSKKTCCPQVTILKRTLSTCFIN